MYSIIVLQHCCVYCSSTAFVFQPSVKNQIDAFWQFFDSNPGPIFAGVVVIGIVESKCSLHDMTVQITDYQCGFCSFQWSSCH